MSAYPQSIPQAPARAAEKPLPPGIRIANAGGQGKLIMIVDDDEGVRLIVEAILAKEGYRVVSAESGEQALEYIGKLGNRVDLVFLDFVMTGMHCAWTQHGLRKAVPGLPIIIISGYTANSTLEKLVNDTGSGFVPKPLAREKLLQGIRGSLGEVPGRR